MTPAEHKDRIQDRVVHMAREEEGWRVFKDFLAADVSPDAKAMFADWWFNRQAEWLARLRVSINPATDANIRSPL